MVMKAVVSPGAEVLVCWLRVVLMERCLQFARCVVVHGAYPDRAVWAADDRVSFGFQVCGWGCREACVTPAADPVYSIHHGGKCKSGAIMDFRPGSNERDSSAPSTERSSVMLRCAQHDMVGLVNLSRTLSSPLSFDILFPHLRDFRPIRFCRKQVCFVIRLDSVGAYRSKRFSPTLPLQIQAAWLFHSLAVLLVAFPARSTRPLCYARYLRYWVQGGWLLDRWREPPRSEQAAEEASP